MTLQLGLRHVSLLQNALRRVNEVKTKARLSWNDKGYASTKSLGRFIDEVRKHASP